MTAADEIRAMVFGYRLSQALHVAAVLGISDLLADGPRTIDDLASAANADADSVGRVLRAPAAHSVYIESEDGRFANTELSSALRADVPGSVRATAVYVGESYTGTPGDISCTAPEQARTHSPRCTAQMCGPIGRSISTGQIPSTGRWAMTATMAGTVATAYDFSGVSIVVDVGGGHGALLEAWTPRRSCGCAASRCRNGPYFSSLNGCSKARTRVPIRSCPT